MQVSHDTNQYRDLRNTSVRPQLKQVGHRIARSESRHMCPVMQDIMYGEASFWQDRDMKAGQKHNLVVRQL